MFTRLGSAIDYYWMYTCAFVEHYCYEIIWVSIIAIIFTTIGYWLGRRKK